MFMTVFYKNTILFRLVKSGTNEVSTYTKRRLHNGLGFWLFGSLIIRLVAQSFQRTQSV